MQENFLLLFIIIKDNQRIVILLINKMLNKI